MYSVNLMINIPSCRKDMYSVNKHTLLIDIMTIRYVHTVAGVIIQILMCCFLLKDIQ